MKKHTILTVIILNIFIMGSCKANSNKESEESITVSSTNKSTESFDMSETIEQKFPMNGGPSPREKDIIEGMTVPDEILEIAEQKLHHYFLPEELVVENRNYHTSEMEESRVVVELLDNLQTKDLLTAYLDENGQVKYYKFEGDSESHFYDFIEYFEKSEEIVKSIRDKRLKTGEADDKNGGLAFFKVYSGEKFEYSVDYNMQRFGINRFIVEITYPDK